MYRPTLEALLPALAGGLSPEIAYEIFQDAEQQRAERRSYLDQLREQEEAEREAARAARQQTFAGLGGTLFEGAASGMPLPAARRQLDFLMEATPGVGPRMEGRLEGLLDQAYPRTRVPDMAAPPPRSVQHGTLEEIARDRPTTPGPRARVSPMYVPPPPEPGETPDIPDLSQLDVQIGSDEFTGEPITGPVGPAISQAVTADRAAGLSLEESLAGAQRYALRQGIVDPATLQAIAQQVVMLWETTPEPVRRQARPRPGQAQKWGSPWGPTDISWGEGLLELLSGGNWGG